MSVNGPIPIQKHLPLHRSMEDQDQKLRQAAKMYEKHFLNELVKGMRSTVNEGGFIQKNFAEKIYNSELDQQYVEMWGDQGGIGLSDLIYDQMKDKIFPDQNIQKPQGPLPIQNYGPRNQKMIKVTPSPTMEKGAQWKFEKINGEVYDPIPVSSPWSGKISHAIRGEQDRNFIQVQHDNGLRSKLSFVGSMGSLQPGSVVKAQQTLGILSPGSAALTWAIVS